MMLEIKEIIESAIEKNQLDEVLLGRDPYIYNSKYSSTPYGYDLIEILDFLNDHLSEKYHHELINAISRIINSYEGIIPVLIIILFCALKKNKKADYLDLDIGVLSNMIQKTILAFEEELKNDYSGVGNDYPDGLYGDVKRLCNNISEISSISII